MDSSSSISSGIAFPNYVVDTHPTGPWFYAFVVAYTGVSFILIGVLVSWGRNSEKDSLLAGEEKQQPHTYDVENDPLPVVEPVVKVENDTAPSETPSSTKPESSSSSRAPDGVEQDTEQNKNNVTEDLRTMNDGAKSLRKQVSKSRIGMVLREIDRVAYPDHDPAFISRISSQTMGAGRSAVSGNSRIQPENLSNVPSAATTSQIRSSESVTTGQQRHPTRIWDVSGRRWKNRRPIGRVDVIQNAITQEALSALSGRSRSLVGGSGGSKSFRARGSLVPDVNISSSKFSKGMSDVASSVLEEQSKDGRTLVFSSLSSSGRTRKPFRRRSHTGSISLASERSHMASIIDDITPNDAADANDPGLGNVFVSIDSAQTMSGFGVKLGCLSSPVEALLTLAEPETEIRRVIRLAAPLTLGAVSEPLFRLITAVFISNYLGLESMIAFVLVVLFVRLTSEQLSGAIIDSLSSFVQDVLHTNESDGTFLAGQYVQHGIVLQVILGVPTLAAWALTMDKVVYWLVQSDEIASIAQDYTRVVVLNYLAQAVGRTCTVVFHICGYEHFESIIDFSASALTMLAVCCIVSLVDEVNLPMLGYVQVLTGVAACMAKVAYPILRGWVRPFQKGMLQTVALYQVCSENSLLAACHRLCFFDIV
jgi:hypothetical protein